MTADLLLDRRQCGAGGDPADDSRAGRIFRDRGAEPARALEQFQGREFPAQIQLVITDHLMPGMSGSEFVRELRKTHPALPVLVISGLEEAERSMRE